MDKLAKQAMDAHGDLERWNRFTTLSARLIAPLKSPMLRRKAGGDGGVQWTPSGRQTPKRSTAKCQKMNKELLP